VLEKLVPRENEAASRAWIDAFFFRASAMVPQGKQLVLSLELSMDAKPSSTTTLGGYIDYAVFSASALALDSGFDGKSHLELLETADHTLFVAEAKTSTVPLEGHVPQAVAEMYACAIRFGKKFVRGTVTDGQNWIFLVLKMDANGVGAKYSQSKRIRLMTITPPINEYITREMCRVISGILLYWIEHSNEDIEENDWFYEK
jgi:hypothetical protein